MYDIVKGAIITESNIGARKLPRNAKIIDIFTNEDKTEIWATFITPIDEYIVDGYAKPSPSTEEVRTYACIIEYAPFPCDEFTYIGKVEANLLGFSATYYVLELRGDNRFGFLSNDFIEKYGSGEDNIKNFMFDSAKLSFGVNIDEVIQDELDKMFPEEDNNKDVPGKTKFDGDIQKFFEGLG
jgi:hypothetical protein